MMRKIAAMAVSLFLIGTQTVKAEGLLGLGKITTDGSLEVLGNSANNEADFNGKLNDHRGGTISRVRVGLGLPDITENVSGRIEVVRNSNAGPQVQYGNNQPVNMITEQGLWLLQNAYVNVNGLFDLDMFRLGRQYIGEHGDALFYVGPVQDDAMTVTAIDGLRAQKKYWKLSVDGFTGKFRHQEAVPGTAAATEAVNPVAGGDINISYVTVAADDLFPVRVPLQIGYYNGKNNQVTTTNADNMSLTIMDLRAGVNFLDDALKLSGEYAKNGGKDNNGVSGTQKSKFKGNGYFLKGTYVFEGPKVGLHLQYANASGDNQNGTNVQRESSDKSFHDFSVLGGPRGDLRFGEIFGYGDYLKNQPGVNTQLGMGFNILAWGADWTPQYLDKKTTLSLDNYIIKVNKVATGGSKSVGAETDLAALYRYSSSVEVRAGAAFLKPASGLANGFLAGNAATDMVTKYFAKLTIKWGGEKKEEASPVRKAAPAYPTRRR
jgi:hypothetical protein